MFYDFSITIPAGTQKKKPEEVIVNLVSGIIHRLELWFPAGCRGTAFVAIYQGNHQLWPTNIDGAFSAENFTIAIDEVERLPAGPNQFRILGWSPEAQFSHKIRVRFGILSPEAMTPFADLGTKLRKLLRLMGVK